MTVVGLLSRLRERRIEVTADGDRLRVRAPEGALTADLQSEIARRKAEILALLAGPAETAPAAIRPVAAGAGAGTPLSFAQERFWFLEQLEAGTSAYHLLFAIRAQGALDAGAVRGALDALIARHAALRTGFVEQDGRPHQVAADRADPGLRVIDLQHLPAAARHDEALRIAHEASREPFDLGRPPLMRNLLLRTAPDDWLLVFVLHHIVSDGWSVGVLMRDFIAAYGAGGPAALPALPVQYADFAAWQREAFAAGDFAAQTAYWKRQLADLPTLDLPTDRPRPSALSVRGAEHRFTIDAPLAAALAAFGQRERATLFMTLFAGFQALLHRYSQQDDLAAGTAIAGRNTADFEEVVGPFINTLVLRTSFAGRPGFRETLRRVRDAALDAYANQDLPFERLVDELQPVRDLSRNPLCQVIFALQNLPAAAAGIDGLTLSVVPVERVTAALDMDWMVYPAAEGLEGTIRYSTDLFDEPTVARMARHYVRLLERAMAAPDAPVAGLSMLDAREHRLVTSDWNQTTRPYPQAGIAELFERQAARRPEAIALSDGDERLTYGELNRRANRLAHFLIDRGVGADALVGVFQERSIDAIVSLLAIVKAGGAYLPLDPDYPRERLALMLGDARPGVLLTRQRFLDRLPDGTGGIVCLDADAPRLAGWPDANPAPRSALDHLAYVTYTSGSTGVPKGVEVRQRGVVRLLFGVDYVHIDEQACFLQLASISFDASTLEIWGALLHGARLAILAESVPTPDELGQVLAREGVSILWLTSSFFNAVIDARPDALAGVGQLLIGGEALSVAHVRRAQAALPQTTIINGYGPTESTTFTCCYRIPALPADGVVSIPIGRPIGNTTVFVLDGTLQPVPVGVPGELFIGGDGLARGYLHHPALTAEKFVAAPDLGPAGARLYRTGDRVRYLADGLIQFLGRDDDQVKIRGFRVELGEIEQALLGHPEVREAAVVVQERGVNDRRLVAYLTARAQPADERLAAALRQFARQTLPPHMVPSAFVPLAALPLTAHGKLDRRALPDPEPARGDAAPVAPPRSEAERALAEVWARVLRVEQVGADDNFFELGGDSILSLQVVSGARERGFTVTPRQIFEHPTVAELARVAGTRPARIGPGLERPRAAGAAVALTPIQCWFFEQAFVRPGHFNHAVLLASREPLDPSPLRAAIDHLIDRHDALRLRFARTGDGWQQSAAPPGHAPFESVDLSAAEPDAQRLAIERHATALQASLDLARGPLVRAALFDLGPAGTRLLLVVHHLAIDAVSWRLVIGELQTVYEQLRVGLPPRLPLPGVSFVEWAGALAAQAERFAGEAPYWAAVADGPVSALPLDRPEADDTFGAARTVEAWFTAAETRGLLHEASRAYGMRIQEVLLAALAGAVSEWSGQPAVLVDVEAHGRDAVDDLDVSATVGWFTALYPVRLDLAGCASLDDELKAVKEQLRRVPNRGRGYGMLRYLGADPSIRRRLDAAPAPEIAFNYLGQFDDVFSGRLLTPAVEPIGPSQADEATRPHLLEISARVLGERLHVAWHYGAARLEAATVDALCRRHADRVRAIVAQCQSREARAFTPSDFPEAKVSQDQLDRLMAQLNAGGKA